MFTAKEKSLLDIVNKTKDAGLLRPFKQDVDLCSNHGNSNLGNNVETMETLLCSSHYYLPYCV